MRIDERVREAHLNHFCPGGASFPVTDSGPVGLDPELLDTYARGLHPAAGYDRHAPLAAPQICVRLAVAARVEDALPIGPRGEGFQAEVYRGLLPRER